MASADLASIAAATAAGYKLVQTDRNAFTPSGSAADRYVAVLEKQITGDPDGGSGDRFAGIGVGATSTVARTQALAALNGKRLLRYGADTGTVSNGKKNQNAHVRDVT